MASHHDALVKNVYGQPEHARGTLKSLLPPALVAQLDFDTLAIDAGSFTEDDDTEVRSDLLYSLQTTHAKPVLVYVMDAETIEAVFGEST